VKTRGPLNATGILTGLFLAIGQPAASFADESQILIIDKNVILQPGDVINFRAGFAAFLGIGDYGHTGMYLGKVPIDGSPLFLDFTTDKSGRYPSEFRGRISSEKDFLNDNIGHKGFDVYRLNGTQKLNVQTFQPKLLESAQEIAKDKTFGAFIDCANAASRALSVAANLPIVEIRPDGFADDFRFDAVSLTVNIKDALNELEDEQDKENRDKSSSASFFQGVAGIQLISSQVQDALSAQVLADEAAYRADLETRKRQFEEKDRILHERIDAEVRIEENHLRFLATWPERWEYLREMTGLACSNPGALEEQMQLGHVHDVAIEDLDLVYMMERTESTSLGGEERPLVNSCQKFLLMRILKTNGLISGASLLAWANRYRDENPSLLTVFTTKIGDMFAAMGNAFGDRVPDIGDRDDSSSRGSPRITNNNGNRATDAQREQWRAGMANQVRDEQEIANKVHGVYAGANNKSWDGNPSSKIK
jgi:hypothetical protein